MYSSLNKRLLTLYVIRFAICFRIYHQEFTSHNCPMAYVDVCNPRLFLEVHPLLYQFVWQEMYPFHIYILFKMVRLSYTYAKNSSPLSCTLRMKAFLSPWKRLFAILPYTVFVKTPPFLYVVPKRLSFQLGSSHIVAIFVQKEKTTRDVWIW